MQPLLRGRREMSSLFVGESFCWGGGNFNPVAERATGLNGFEGGGVTFWGSRRGCSSGEVGFLLALKLSVRWRGPWRPGERWTGRRRRRIG